MKQRDIDKAFKALYSGKVNTIFLSRRAAVDVLHNTKPENTAWPTSFSVVGRLTEDFLNLGLTVHWSSKARTFDTPSIALKPSMVPGKNNARQWVLFRQP